MKTDETLHHQFADEYSNKECGIKDAHVAKLGKMNGHNLDPSKLNGSIDWKKSLQVFKDFLKEYEDHFET